MTDKSGGSQKGVVGGVNTREGTKDSGKRAPTEGPMSYQVRGTAPVSGLEGVGSNRNDTIRRASPKGASLGAGLTSSMGKWPVSPKSKTDDRI